MTTKTNKKQMNIEGKFFGMIVLAWVALAVLFNVAYSALPQAKAPAAAKAVQAPAARATQPAQVAVRR